MYVQDTPSHLAALREALERSDPPAIARTAHTLKGSSGFIGALEVARLAAELEERSHHEARHQAEQLVVGLEASFERVRLQFSSLGRLLTQTASNRSPAIDFAM